MNLDGKVIERLLARGVKNNLVCWALEQMLQCFDSIVENTKGECRAKGYCYYHQGKREQQLAAHKDSLGAIYDPKNPKIYTDEKNVSRGENAIERAIRQHKDVKRAMYTPECGYIDFDWGTTGNPMKDYDGGWGLAHIAAKHPHQVKDIPRIITDGIPYAMPQAFDKFGNKCAKRIAIVKDNVVVFLDKRGRNGTFAITGYKRDSVKEIIKNPRAKPLGL